MDTSCVFWWRCVVEAYCAFWCRYVGGPDSYLRFWYQVFTCVSVKLSEAASSIRSCTLRYFCRSKLLSSCASWWSVKAVRAFLGFFMRVVGLSRLLEISRSVSSLTKIQQQCKYRTSFKLKWINLNVQKYIWLYLTYSFYVIQSVCSSKLAYSSKIGQQGSN